MTQGCADPKTFVRQEGLQRLTKTRDGLLSGAGPPLHAELDGEFAANVIDLMKDVSASSRLFRRRLINSSSSRKMSRYARQSDEEASLTAMRAGRWVGLMLQAVFMLRMAVRSPQGDQDLTPGSLCRSKLPL